MSKAVQVTTATFEEQVILSEQPVIVDFYADWCGPCKMLSPVLEQLAIEHTDVKITKVNVDEEPPWPSATGSAGFPTWPSSGTASWPSRLSATSRRRRSRPASASTATKP